MNKYYLLGFFLLGIFYKYRNKIFRKKNNTITPKLKRTTSLKQFDVKNTSSTYYLLSLIIPTKTKSMSHLNELIKNKSNIMYCCNPECKKELSGYIFCAYDGFYCSENCRNDAIKHISVYWHKI